MKLNLKSIWKLAKTAYGVGVIVVPIAKSVLKSAKKPRA